MASNSQHTDVKSSEYVEDDDSASNSSGEVEKPPVSLFSGEASAVEAVQRLSTVLGSIRVDDDGGLEDGSLISPSALCIPSLDVDRERDDMFAALPDDCLAAVFRKLSNKDLANCALVCKWWFMVDALSRSSLSLRATDELAPQLPKLLNRFQGVHKLVLKCDRSMQSITDDSLGIIAHNCLRLRKFKLKNCKRITDAGMESFARACPELRKFSCGGCGFGVNGLSSLLRHCTNLEDLTVKRSIRLAPVAVHPENHGQANEDPNTLTLALADGGRIVVGIPILFDPNTGQPLQGNQRIHHVSHTVNLGTGALAPAPGPGGGNVAGAAAAALGLGPGVGRPDGSTMPQLDLPESLNLRRLCLKDQNVSQMWVPLLEAAKKVETLILARNLGSWDPVLASSLGAKGMPELTQLYLEKLHITDRGLRSVACCPKLEALVVVRTGECTDEGISAIAQGCATLKRLHIEGWAPGHIGDRGLNSLAHHCRLLQELVLVGHSCTVSSMQPLATNCPNLERLTLCSSLSMSDLEMKVIASSCPSLRRLCVKACMGVTDVGIFALATGCPSLQKLKIRRCTGVSQSSLDYLQDQRPDLSITQESSAAATAAAEAQRRNRAAAEAEGHAAAPGRVARVFDERDDMEFDARAIAERRREHRDESPEVLRRFGSLGPTAGDNLARGRQGGARARFAQAATSIQRALRSWIGAPGPAPGAPGVPTVVPGSTTQVGVRPFSPLRDRELRENREGREPREAREPREGGGVRDVRENRDGRDTRQIREAP